MMSTENISRVVLRTAVMLFAAVLALAASIFVWVNSARAADIVSWTQYTDNGSSIEWMIDADGVLIIQPISGTTGVLQYNTSSTGTNTPPWYDNRYSVKKVVVSDTIEVHGSAYRMFYNLSAVDYTGMNKVDVSHVTSMDNMFMYFGTVSTSSLPVLDLSSWDVSHVTSMVNMFTQCRSELNLSGWNTSSVTSMHSMFQYYYYTGALDLSSFDFSSITDAKDMLSTSTISALDISSFNIPASADMTYMYQGLTHLERMELGYHNPFRSGVSTFPETGPWVSEDRSFGPYSKFDMVTYYDGSTMSGTWVLDSAIAVFDSADNSLKFYNSTTAASFVPTSTQTIYKAFDQTTTGYSPWKEHMSEIETVEVVDYGIAPKSMSEWFLSASNLVTADLSKLDTSDVTSFYQTFSGCSNCETLNITGWDTSNAKNMNYMFFGCSKLTTLDVGGFNTAKVTNLSNMFTGCSSLTSLDLSNWNTSSLTTMNAMFNNCAALTSVNISSFDTSNVTSFSDLFRSCSSLTSVDVSSLNTSKVTNMSFMFAYCPALSSINFGTNFDTSKVTTMANMFTNDESFTSIDVSVFDTSSVKNMTYMFRGCSGLTTLNLTNFDTHSVTDMSYMFNKCFNLISVELSSFNTSAVTTMESMFYECTNLRSLDLHNFSTPSLANSSYMFCYCSNLGSLDVSSMDTTHATKMTSMFTYDYVLSSVNLGENWTFKGNSTSVKVTLPTPSPLTQYSGKWVKSDDPDLSYTSADLASNYNGASMAGTWVWQEKLCRYTINFSNGGIGTGSMAQETPLAEEDFTIPASGFFYPGKKVVAWSDGTRRTFEAGGVIPANTYEAGSTVTLTAQWEDMNAIAQTSFNTYELELAPGMSATIPNIPAGTPYRVYEQTESGWVLVEQSNTSGIIRALDTQIAKFKNQYNPVITSAVIYGLKTIDGRTAEAGTFTFELWEGDTKIEEVTNSDAGAIVFSPVVYNSEGTHEYKIREVVGNDASVVYDEHEELITVVITKDGENKLKATVTYDDDGVKFVNKHTPGNLELTKLVEGASEANADDEFEFKITLRNENGEPVTEGVYIHYGE